MKINAYMKQYKVTVKEMATRSGVTERSIYQYRKGKIPNGNTIKRIVKASGGKITAADLIR